MPEITRRRREASRANGSAPALPPSGAVLGVDIGFSLARRTSAVCRLDLTSETITWTSARVAAVEPERTDTLCRLADRPLLAAAFDGPLTRGFEIIGRYRAAERMLTRRIGGRIGKPGSSGAPVGKLLNAATNTCATIVRATGKVGAASHAVAIDAAAIIEAFPGAALGLMIAEPEALEVRRGNRSDVFFEMSQTPALSFESPGSCCPCAGSHRRFNR